MSRRTLSGLVVVWVVVLATVAACRDEYERLRKLMVETQLRARGITNKRVLDAMLKVPRHEFVPKQMRAFAYEDHPLPIGFGQTISQPYIVAFMTEALDPKPTDKVLEIGTGSGYQAAVLAEIVDQVYTIEIIPELAKRAQSTLERLGYKNVHVRTGDGFFGWKEAAPFDKIIVTAAAPKVPKPLIEQLKEGGRLCIPVEDSVAGQVLRVFVKRKGRLELIKSLPVRFVPMTGKVREK